MVNTKAIKERMDELNVTFDDLGRALKKAPVTVRQKIANVRPIFLDEAEIIQHALDIPDEQFVPYFLAKEPLEVREP